MKTQLNVADFVAIACNELEKMKEEANRDNPPTERVAVFAPPRNTNGDQHLIYSVFDPGVDVGYLYTAGLSALHPSKTEFICTKCPREHIVAVSNMFNFLANRLLSGHDVCPNHNASSPGVVCKVLAISDDHNQTLLRSHAKQVDRQTKLLRIKVVSHAVPPAPPGMGWSQP